MLISPSSYISLLANLNSYSEVGYLKDQTAGYNIIEIKDYLESLSKDKDIIVTFGLNTGNPESALLVYLINNKHITSMYLDSNFFGGTLQGLDCLRAHKPLYFISRQNQLVGLDKFLFKVEAFKNPFNSYSIGVYKLKSPCFGKTGTLLIKTAIVN